MNPDNSLFKEFTQSRTNPSVNLEAEILGSYSALNKLVFRGPKAHPTMTTPMRMTTRVWEQMSARLNTTNTISPYTPLWGNPRLHHLQSIPDLAVWTGYDNKTWQQIMPKGRLLSYDDLKHTFQLSLKMFFRYLQLRHAIQAQFLAEIQPRSHVVERFLISSNADRILSSVYLWISSEDNGRGTELFHKSKEDLPPLRMMTGRGGSNNISLWWSQLGIDMSS